MLKSRFRKRRLIPSSRDTRPFQVLDYSKGYNSELANDVVAQNQLVYATDARIPTLGAYETRKGWDNYTAAAGETINDQETSTTGAADKSFNNVTRLAIKFTASSAGRLTKTELRLKNDAGASGPVRIDLYTDVSGSPGVLTASTSIDNPDILSTYSYLPAYWVQAPVIANATSYWLVVYRQDSGSGDYKISSTTTATTAKTSADSGSTWSTTTYDLNFKTYLSTDSTARGLYRAYKSTGTKTTLLAHGTNLYSVNDVTGALTSIKSGLTAGTSKYRFEVANDIVYYVNGVDAPRKWDFTTESATTGSPATSSNIKLHKNQMFYVNAAERTKIFWSDIAAFETFTSTNFLYVPSPKSPDPVTSMFSLNDILYIQTENTKWALYGSDISTFEIAQAPGTKGTFSQESVVSNRNYAFFASNDGIYQFNGTTDEKISVPIDEEYNAIALKGSIVLAIDGNRLYVYYPSAGSATNDSCFVYNLDFQAWESRDLNTPVAFASNWLAASDDSQMIVASPLVGQAFYANVSSNNFSQAGSPLTWEIRPRYEHFGNPSRETIVKRWYPRFERLGNSYNVLCQYDFDFRDSPNETSVDLSSTGPIWGGGDLWGDGLTWGSEVLGTARLSIPGAHEHTQVRYKRAGVNTPVKFLSHSFEVKDKRSK